MSVWEHDCVYECVGVLVCGSMTVCISVWEHDCVYECVGA